MKLNQKSSMREDRMSQPWMNWTQTHQIYIRPAQETSQATAVRSANSEASPTSKPALSTTVTLSVQFIKVSLIHQSCSKSCFREELIQMCSHRCFCYFVHYIYINESVNQPLKLCFDLIWDLILFPVVCKLPSWIINNICRETQTRQKQTQRHKTTRKTRSRQEETQIKERKLKHR